VVSRPLHRLRSQVYSQRSSHLAPQLASQVCSRVPNRADVPRGSRALHHPLSRAHGRLGSPPRRLAHSPAISHLQRPRDSLPLIRRCSRARDRLVSLLRVLRCNHRANRLVSQVHGPPHSQLVSLR
jgi:hypothetical protein